jgi:hypothetical protein
MTAIRVLTDEDVHRAVAAQLRAAGVDAASTPEVGRLGFDDPSQLRWAASQSRVLVTFNVEDFARLHHDWASLGEHHAGLVVSAQRGVGDTIRRLLRRVSRMSAEDMLDRLEYLSNC